MTRVRHLNDEIELCTREVHLSLGLHRFSQRERGLLSAVGAARWTHSSHFSRRASSPGLLGSAASRSDWIIGLSYMRWRQSV